jgi:two-component sensor histidine kinase
MNRPRNDLLLGRSLATLRVGSLVLPLLGALVWGAWILHDERRRSLEQAYENVALIRQYAQRVIQTQTILQDAVKVHTRMNDQPGYLQSERFHLFLSAVERAQSFTNGLAVLDLQGRLIASSRTFPVNYTFGERRYLSEIRGGADLFVDRIRLDPGGEDSLVVAQSFDLGGEPGAVVSAINVESVRDFLSSIASREGEAASLLRDDGQLLVRHVPSDPTQLTRSVPVLEAIQSAPHGHYEAVAMTDGVYRLYAYSQLSTLPIYANFGFPQSGVWSNAFWRALPAWLLLISGGAFSWILAGMIKSGFEARLVREEEARRRLVAEQKAEQHERYTRELNHRVKNNLTMVDSLIGFQMRTKGAVDGAELRVRVRAIADVHDTLYRAADAHHMDLGALVTHLCKSAAVIPQEASIRLVSQIERDIMVDADKATALALIVVEIITNAVKHAFVGKEGGTISVKLCRHEDEAELIVSDDGVGLPARLQRRSGTRMIHGFVEQVSGRLEQSSTSGTTYRIVFPIA